MARFSAIAKEAGIWLSLGGFQETGPDPEHIYNTHVILNSSGAITARYRKVRALCTACMHTWQAILR
jgi:predicted amidohydrolase